MRSMILLCAALLLQLCAACSKQTNSTPEPKLPKAADGPAHVKPATVPLVFFFGDEYRHLFIRLSGDDWKPDEAALGKPALEHFNDVVAVSRPTIEKTPLSGTRLDIFRDEKKACSEVIGDLKVVSRATPHFGQREDLGVSTEQGKVLTPKFDDILSQSWHYLGFGLDECGARAADHVNEFIWARPSELGEPVIWARADDASELVSTLKPKVAAAVMAMEFGKKTAQYTKLNPEELVTVTTGVFGKPGAREYLVEDHHQVGETTCGGNGHEQWSLWMVVEGKPQRLLSEDTHRKIRLVADLDNDGHLEIVTQDGYYGNERTLWRLRDGKLEKIKEDKYPFNDCGC